MEARTEIGIPLLNGTHRDEVAILEPVGIAEVASMLGVERNTVDAWKHRGILPEPRWTVGGRPAWDAERDILPWAKETGKLPEVAIILEVNIATGNLDTSSGIYDVYRIRTGHEFTSFDDLEFIETVHELPEGAVRINEDEPANPDYVATYKIHEHRHGLTGGPLSLTPAPTRSGTAHPARHETTSSTH